MEKNETNLYRTKYSSKIYEKTKHYQKIYGFEIGEGKHDTWNNEADAFKHTFMQADLALKYSLGLSKIVGDYHEYEGKISNQDSNEENMDKWNNAQGREIAQEILNEIGHPVLLRLYVQTGKLDDLIAMKVMQRMRTKKLITTPKDKRRFSENNTVDIPEDKIFTAEEIGAMSVDEFSKNEKAIYKQLNTMGIPRKFQADQEVKNGTMIWVDAYTRDDGTKVKGYYRRK